MFKKFFALILITASVFSLTACGNFKEEPLTQLTDPYKVVDVVTTQPTDYKVELIPEYETPESTINRYTEILIYEDIDSYVDILTLPESKFFSLYEDIKRDRFGKIVNSSVPENSHSGDYEVEIVLNNELSKEYIEKFAKNYKKLAPNIVITEGREIEATVDFKTGSEDSIRTFSFILLNEGGNWKVHKAVPVPFVID